MTYKAVQDSIDAHAWRVEAINHDGDGEVYTAVFYGPDSRSRAEEYAAMKNAGEEPRSQIVPISGVSQFPGAGRATRHCYLSLSLDGNQWCALFGSNLQDGVAGFGDTPTEAVNEFESQFKTANDRPPIPTTAFDWSAWIEGREEWKTGRGPTEAEAIRDLLERIEE